jgi:6,7-dimethyl-8-ribityllumazine synthase
MSESAELPEAPPETDVSGPPAEGEHASGELRLPPGIRTFAGPPNGARRSVGIAVSRFNGEVTTRLLDGALAVLGEAGVAQEAIEIMPVPGAFELPLATMALAKSRRYSCVLALGCVIRGETPHFEYVSSEAASGVQLAGLETGVPVAFGVLTCDTHDQALARAGGSRGNKGAEAARSALEMVESLAQLRASVAG